MSFEWHELSERARTIIEVTIAAGAVLALWPVAARLFRWLRNLSQEVSFMLHHRRDFEALSTKIDALLMEFRPNGGGSMRDALDRIERNMEFVTGMRRAHQNLSNVAMVETDATGRVVWVNRGFVRLFGVDEASVLGSGWVNTVVADEREWAERTWLHAIQEEREFDETITYVNRENGRCFRARATAAPIRGGHGEVLGYLAEILPVMD